jgi:hypothetical protein
MLTSEGWTFQGNHIVAVGWPALKRRIKVEALSRSAKALLPRMNAGAPTTNPAVFRCRQFEPEPRLRIRLLVWSPGFNLAHAIW